MTDKPILFSGDMVRAILDGRKTQTRRKIEEWRQPSKTDDDGTFEDEAYISIAVNHRRWGFGVFGATESECMENYNSGYNSCNPYGQSGDRLWVREGTIVDHDTSEVIALSKYAADDAPVLYPGKEVDENGEPDFGGSMAHWWYSRKSCPSIHMPRWASRLTLTINNVRVERLQDISNEDCIKEGIEYDTGGDLPDGCDSGGGFFNYIKGDTWDLRPRDSFYTLWSSINGADSWAANPWVWVIDFTPHLCNIDDMQEAA